MKQSHLYIDELGSPNPKSTSHPYFIISSCVFRDGSRDRARTLADQIKFKYWGAQRNFESIIFHSYDIGRKTGSFAIFKNEPAKHKEFIDDIFKLLTSSGMTIFVNVTDLAEARKKNWNTNAVLKRASSHIVGSFIYYLLGRQTTGKIIIESATDVQNFFFLKTFNYHLSPNAIQNISYQQVQESMTSLSFVTKNNHDIEEQIADIFAYAARCKYEREECGKKFSLNSYEDRIIKVLESKFFSMPANVSPQKKQLYGKIESYKILTK